ncbi:hypothetical protein NL676_006720 [Syzygium grande]|nr:hypothetical protein NL676_006720 [Syzygium grande]
MSLSRSVPFLGSEIPHLRISEPRKGTDRKYGRWGVRCQGCQSEVVGMGRGTRSWVNGARLSAALQFHSQVPSHDKGWPSILKLSSTFPFLEAPGYQSPPALSQAPWPLWPIGHARPPLLWPT